jgi:hypothetical protein
LAMGEVTPRRRPGDQGSRRATATSRYNPRFRER